MHHSVTLGFARPLGRMPFLGKFCLLYDVQCENEFGACLGGYFRVRSCDGISSWSSGIDSKLLEKLGLPMGGVCILGEKAYVESLVRVFSRKKA